MFPYANYTIQLLNNANMYYTLMNESNESNIVDA